MTEATLSISQPNQILSLFGPRDQNVRLLRERFDVTITHRDGHIRVAGPQDEVRRATQALEHLRDMLIRNGVLSHDDVDAVLADVDGDSRPGKVRSAGEIQIRHAGRRIKPRTEGQARYVATIRNHDLSFSLGPAGTGKTYLAVAMAVEALKAEAVRKIVLVRPAVEAGESLGFLPGDLRAKLNPYLRPLLDALGEMVDYDHSRTLMEQDVIEVIPLAYMRGRTLNDAFIILDEAQNTTVAQMKMFLTRLGERSKMVVSGDSTQVDLPRGVQSGLIDAIGRLRNVKGIGLSKLEVTDIVRHRLVQEIVNAYEEDKG
ncbi:PhoH-like protein [Rosistilla carotiformis]|uniref:PhoH-like protein n=1 Tax=Rosistilla carotiformis TaxID=2528017 RepID=A0A518JUE4_9BACT|nr:PhoH family protein [Rosistilla carotiformis]QDV69170.1 PhoH-like protein [Rosistilla carotiformis]